MTAKANLPLAGLRIVDISNVFSLPYAGGLFADLGAEVIKIEGPGRLDVTRQGAFSGVHPDNDPADDAWNRTSTFNLLNRGKKSLALDLSRPEGRDVLKDLIKVSDLVMENFTPRVMRNWKMDYPHLSQLKPGIVMVSCSGYGPQGPWSQYPAQATTQEATHGLVSVTGYPGDVPSKAGQSFVDFLATWALVMGTTLALRYRHRFGKGLWVDVAMYQLGCYMVSDSVLDWEANKRLRKPIGNRHAWLAPQGCYRCAGEDAWCTLVVRDDDEWAALCQVIGRPELAHDPRYQGDAARMALHDDIDAMISAWMKDVPKFDAMERLQQAGVPAGAVFNARDMHLNPHMRSRDFLEPIQMPCDPPGLTRPVIGRPWKLNNLSVKARGPAPQFGQHNQEILQGILGYSDAQYNALVDDGITGTKPTKLRPLVRMSMDERVKSGRFASWDPDYMERIRTGK